MSANICICIVGNDVILDRDDVLGDVDGKVVIRMANLSASLSVMMLVLSLVSQSSLLLSFPQIYKPSVSLRTKTASMKNSLESNGKMRFFQNQLYHQWVSYSIFP